jgi:hypothetical protein
VEEWEDYFKATGLDVEADGRKKDHRSCKDGGKGVASEGEI